MWRIITILSFASSILGAVGPDTLLWQYPMIMAHDAATGYMDTNFATAYIQTQTKDFGGQADCGVRVFDIRVECLLGTPYLHHGPIPIFTKLETALNDAVSWADNHPGELIISHLSHYGGDKNCSSITTNLLSKMKLKSLTQCSQLSNLTHGQAVENFRTPKGGSFMAVPNDSCWQSDYDPSIVCYGDVSSSSSSSYSSMEQMSDPADWSLEKWQEALANATSSSSSSPSIPQSSKTEYVCYGANKDVPWAAMNNYINRTTSSFSSGRFKVTQALWQEDTTTVERGYLMGSSLVKDESKSQINNILDERITTLGAINIWEMNNVCDGGLAVAKSLANRS